MSVYACSIHGIAEAYFLNGEIPACKACLEKHHGCKLSGGERSNTAMTMPSKIWADEDHMYWLEKKDSTDTPYIRADLAEDLARALEFMLRGPVRSSPMLVQECEGVLARFRAQTKPPPDFSGGGQVGKEEAGGME